MNLPTNFRGATATGILSGATLATVLALSPHEELPNVLSGFESPELAALGFATPFLLSVCGSFINSYAGPAIADGIANLAKNKFKL